ncbi:hypothetical protein ASC58_10195 [Phycicoccus sp. Root101]|nr:hypothetical protein ASC58_10195 [Phycicoccus sp. Root101]
MRSFSAGVSDVGDDVVPVVEVGATVVLVVEVAEGGAGSLQAEVSTTADRVTVRPTAQLRLRVAICSSSTSLL